MGRLVDGRFKVLQLVARGGMGKVYRAEQQPLGRICALKVLNPKHHGADDPEFQQRFFLEAATAAKLNHPNTVTIFDYGRDEELYFIAMEFLAGRTLYRTLREEGRLDSSRTLRILRQICRSLRGAHAQAVIHRDIKPANIVLLSEADEPDTVKVLDFGLVKVIDDERQDLTQKGTFLGSPKYMAPEQILGHDMTPAADVYSCAVVAYEMLCGKVPFDHGSSVKNLMAQVHEEPPTMYERVPGVDIDPRLHDVVMRCLRKDPTLRYRDMDELLDAFASVDGGRGSASLVPMSRRAMSSPPPPPPSLEGDDEPPAASIPAPVPIPDALKSAETTAEPSLELPTLDAYRDETTEQLPEEPRAAAQGRSVALLVLGALAMMAFGATAVVVGFGDADTMGLGVSDTPAPQPIASAAPSASSTGTVSGHMHGAVRLVRVTSEPTGAHVERDGKRVCEATPCELRLLASDDAKPARLLLRKPGFEPTTVLVAERGQLWVELQPVVPLFEAPPAGSAVVEDD